MATRKMPNVYKFSKAVDAAERAKMLPQFGAEGGEVVRPDTF